MQKSLVVLSAVVAIFFASGFANAQITITIPDFPKIKKPEPKPTQPPSSDESAPPKSGSDASEPTPEAKNGDCSDTWEQHHLGEIKKTQAEAQEFRPGLRDYYVSELSDRQNLYLEAALSPSKRRAWLKDSKADAATSKCINAGLDELAAVARKTLPTYLGPSGYTFGTPAEKKVLLGVMSDIAEAKVLKVGIKQANWLIAKDDYNFPTARYKHGMVWAHYPTNDSGFCWIYWINLKQDYAGGGTYGSSYGYYVSRTYAGCPAGK